MTYKYPEMSYKTGTANATGFFNGGFPGYGQFPVNGNLLGHGQFPVNGNLLPMSYNYEYQYPTEMSYSAPSFAYKDNIMTYKYPEMSYKTDTAKVTGFFNGGFPGYGNLLGSSRFPGHGNPFSYGENSQSRYQNSKRHGYGQSRYQNSKRHGYGQTRLHRYGHQYGY